MRTALLAGRPGQRVRHDVGHSPLEQSRISLDEGNRLGYVELGAVTVERQPAERRGHHVLQGHRRAAQAQRAALQPAHVEEVRHHPVELIGSRVDGAQQVVSVGG